MPDRPATPDSPTRTGSSVRCRWWRLADQRLPKPPPNRYRIVGVDPRGAGCGAGDRPGRLGGARPPQPLRWPTRPAVSGRRLGPSTAGPAVGARGRRSYAAQRGGGDGGRRRARSATRRTCSQVQMQPLARVVVPPPHPVAVVGLEPVVEAVEPLAEGDQRRHHAVVEPSRPGRRSRRPTKWASELMQNVACSTTTARSAPATNRPPHGSPHSEHTPTGRAEAHHDGQHCVPAVLQHHAAVPGEVDQPLLGRRRAFVRDRKSHPMWAHQKPWVIEYGSPGPSVWAWWSRWSALQASAEFWNAAARTPGTATARGPRPGSCGGRTGGGTRP